MENSALNISLSLSDSIVIGLFFIVLIIIALASAKKSKAGVEDYFGRKKNAVVAARNFNGGVYFFCRYAKPRFRNGKRNRSC